MGINSALGKQRSNIWNKTFNARGESIFEKPSFVKSAEEQRCLIPAEGFYEHHHFRGKKYPFYISHIKRINHLFLPDYGTNGETHGTTK
ncbi:MAG: hypothetical protein GQ525_14140 [Draconibacterium sp.]|nr:hypothetical protein [Draconibacterium sp.]